MFKNHLNGGWGEGLAVRFAALTEDWSSAPSAPVRELTTTSNSSSRDAMPSSGLCGFLYACVHTLTYTRMHMYAHAHTKIRPELWHDETHRHPSGVKREDGLLPPSRAEF